MGERLEYSILRLSDGEAMGWLTPEQFAQDWALAQILPGPNVVNLSIMFGERHFGVRGALAAAGGWARPA